MGSLGRGILIFLPVVFAMVLGEPKANAMGAKKPPVPPPDVLEPGEPAYCSIKTIQSFEKKVSSSGLDRAHLFRLGRVEVLGVGVGNSDVKALAVLGQQHATSSAQKYCTFYFNEGNSEAEKAFEHQYLTNPKDLTTKTGPLEYGQRLGRYFEGGPTSFVECLGDRNYLALGCNGMKHRGPSVFAMILAFSGCTPRHATNVANHFWGLNGVKDEVRLSIAEEGARLGTLRPLQKKRVRDALENP